jgi:protein SCO1/2
MTRRQLLRSAALLGMSVAVRPAFAGDHGRVDPPLPVPSLALRLHDGRTTSLSALLRDHASAVQLMFTSCTSTCPIQGAIFQRVQRQLPPGGDSQLVSLSVDPEHDDPAALARWLARFGARERWIAAAPRREDVEKLRAFGGAGRSASDNHSTRVQIIDRQARLIWRTGDLPEAESLARLLLKV